MSAGQTLARGMAALGFDDDAGTRERLLAYAAGLARWNRVYNLTQVPEGDATITHHLLDSLAIAGHVTGDTVIDVGSGGGMPGIILAIVQPSRAFTLLDSNGKKTRFLEHIRIQLGLDNVQVVQCRSEAHVGSYDVVTCRAFASLADISRLTAHLLKLNGSVLAMKGVLGPEERQQDVSPLAVEQVIPLSVPGIDSERHLVVMKPE